MDQIVHNVRRQNWLNIINQCQDRPAGTTVRSWLSENGIREKSYYYWLRKFRIEAYEANQLQTVAKSDEVTFVEMPFLQNSQDSFKASGPSPVTIRRQDLTIEISNTISQQLLTILLKEIVNA